MARQPFNALPYIAAIQKVIAAMPMPTAEKDAIRHALERHRVHVGNQRQYARLAPRTPEQRAKAAAATKRWRERKLAATPRRAGNS